MFKKKKDKSEKVESKNDSKSTRAETMVFNENIKQISSDKTQRNSQQIVKK